MRKKAIIIGAGPAGLTAAYELLTRTDILPVILEKSGEIGGISRTINYKGNRMDMGPHRFFSKSDRVMHWWLKIMPLEAAVNDEETITYQQKSRTIAPQPVAAASSEKRMLIIQRLTRIYFLRRFFAYPIQLSFETLRTLGLIRTIRILVSFLWIRLFPRGQEKSLEDFIVNRFGVELYKLFFKDYTEKVWGIPPASISAEWGAQRIKGLSLSKAVREAAKSFRRGKKTTGIVQKETETSLIEQFLYPKYGPGSLWEEVARQVQEMGGRIYLNQDVRKISLDEKRIHSINTINSETGQAGAWEGEYFFSTMPVKELIAGMEESAPANVRKIANGLQYRDFINVGVLLKQLSSKEKNGKLSKLELKDNWIYIQERDVKVGRLMIYNNWGGGMIADPNKVWIGMEYFCNTTDSFWSSTDEEIARFAIEELKQMDLAHPDDVLDSTVRRMEKTYPAYFGTYGDFDQVRSFTDKIENLFLVGRNGMHKYNNADHSMLTAMVAVDNIIEGVAEKTNIWAINTEQEYHEEKKLAPFPESAKPSRAASGRKQLAAKYPFGIGFLFDNQWNRAWVILAVLVNLLEFVFFKINYPYANYMPDSYSYLEAAANNYDVNMWPVAYSKFLRFFSVFTHSDGILVGCQYFFFQATSLLFAFSLLYWLRPTRWAQTVLLSFIIFEPIPLYLSNYISADSIFIGCSSLWLTSLIWLIYRPRIWLLVAHGLMLLACFTLRYNAFYYPVVSTIVFLYCRVGWKFKVAGVSLGWLLVGCSVLFTGHKMKEVSGQWQFSAFGGWQLANNALYMYETVPAAEREPVPARFGALEKMVRQHIDTLAKVKYTHEDSVNSYFYLWSGRGPLLQYVERRYAKDSTTPYFKRWATEGPLFGNYAWCLIRKYPWTFVEAFLLPNAVKYAVPPTEFLGMYNMGRDSVRPIAKQWFNYKSLKVATSKKPDPPGPAVSWYPIFNALANTLFILAFTGILIYRGARWKNYGMPQVLALIGMLWLFNFSFSVFASPIVLRYQIFPLLITFSITCILLDNLFILMQEENQQVTPLSNFPLKA